MTDDQPLLFDVPADPATTPPPAAAPEGEPADLFAPPPPDTPGADATDGTAPPDDGPLRRLFDHNFLQYASYVIKDRAIPALLDGLKPVQRRILHALFENDDGKFIKVANIVGHCMQYHPHGDASIGDALVALTNKGYLIEPQGNFGNLYTGDPAAASRYIECRLTDLAREEVFNPELTRFVPSYDGRREEPVALPAKLPLLLMLGAEGIAVGLSTRILPHNFCELLEAQVAILNKEPFALVPDFPQGGTMDATEYARGNGRVRVRAVIETRDPQTLVIRQIPYGTNTDSVIASIELAARKKQVPVKSLNDFTAERVEIEIRLADDAAPDRAIQALYAFTQCEVAVAGRVVVIDGQRPAELDVHTLLERNTQNLLDILQRELRRARATLTEEIHQLTLVQLFVEHRIYQRLETCGSLPELKQTVHDGLAPFRDRLRRDITHADVDKLLSLPVRRISQFDSAKNRADIEKLAADTVDVEQKLARLKETAIRHLRRLLKTYGPAYPRRTALATFEAVALRDLTAQQHVLRLDRAAGYLGYGIGGVDLFTCSSLDRLVVVWDDGRYRVIAPPEKLFVDRTVRYVGLADRDRVMAAVYVFEGIAYLKRFTMGGAILNKEYRLIPTGASLPFFSADDPATLYVRYAPAPNLKIAQQIFDPREAVVQPAKGRGWRLSYKPIAAITATEPPDWSAVASGPKGSLMRL